MKIQDSKQYLSLVWALENLWEASIAIEDKKRAMTVVYNIIVSFFDEAYKDKSNWSFKEPNYYLKSLRYRIKEYREKIRSLK